MKAIICNFTSSTRESISTKPNWIRLYPRNQFPLISLTPQLKPSNKTDPEFPSNIPNCTKSPSVIFTIPYNYILNSTTPTNQINQHPKKNDQPTDSDGNAEHPQGASPSISPAPAPKPPGDMAFGFVAEEFLGESVMDASYDGKLIPGMIDISIQRLLDKTLNLIASHPWVDIKKETMFQSRPWKKLWSVDTTQKSWFMIGRNYNQPYKILWLV